jgi:hypothetical protein
MPGAPASGRTWPSADVADAVRRAGRDCRVEDCVSQGHVDGLVLATSWDSYLSLKALAAYSSLSERMLRGFLRDPEQPLPYYRIGGRIVVRRSDFDAWIAIHRQPADGQTADAIVTAMMGLDGADTRAHRRQRSSSAPRRG